MAIQPSDLNRSLVEVYVDLLEPVIDEQLRKNKHELARPQGSITILDDYYRHITFRHGGTPAEVLEAIRRRYHGWDVSYYNFCGENTGWERFSGLEFRPKKVENLA